MSFAQITCHTFAGIKKFRLSMSKNQIKKLGHNMYFGGTMSQRCSSKDTLNWSFGTWFQGLKTKQKVTNRKPNASSYTILLVMKKCTIFWLHDTPPERFSKQEMNQGRFMCEKKLHACYTLFNFH